MRVLFIYPNLYTQMGFNHGLASLSAVLKEGGHETRMVNLNENLPPVPTPEDVVSAARDWGPGLIGFSCLTMQYESALELARMLRRRSRQDGFELPPLVVGGIHPTMVPEKVMADGVWDYVGVGECEEPLLELADRVEKGERPDDISNFLAWKGGLRPEAADQGLDADLEPLWIRNAVGEFPSLETLPIPDYGLFDTDRITAQKHGWFGLMTSRGCPYRCTYCLNHKVVDLYKKDLGRGVARLGFFRYRPPEKMVEEIQQVLANYSSIETFILDDDLFTMHPPHAIAFCEAYRDAGINVPFVVNSHVKRLDPAVAKALSEAGCKILKLGIESGSPRMRSEVLKRFMSQEDILGTVESAEEYGLHTSGFLMIGLPTETQEERMETVDLLAKARIGRFRMSFFYPFPGTEGYDITLAHGYIKPGQVSAVADFTDGSVLDFGPEENLFVDKLGRAMPWFVNVAMAKYHDSPASELYRPWVERIEAMDAAEWEAFRPELMEVDAELSRQAVEQGWLHYAIRYNSFMGVRSDYFLAEETGQEWYTASAPPTGTQVLESALAQAASQAC